MFSLSKIFWALAQPGNLLVLMLIVAFACLCTKSADLRRVGRVLVGVTAFAAVLITALPLGAWLAEPLQDRFADAVKEPRQVDGIVVLGGGIDTHGSAATGQTQLSEAGDRLLAAATLARRHPSARVVYASGGGVANLPDHREADEAARALRALGLEEGRLILERRSRTTRENAVFAQQLVQPQEGEMWVLITSAWHMPRAIGAFRRLGWDMHPYPVDHIGEGDGALARFAFGSRVDDLNRVSKEWVGLLAYRLSGWTDSLFPGPDG